jgi:two-component system alkaline phosphatase synthesis response regulator PhoP
LARENILVVDDERDIRELLEYNLKKEGFGVVAVASGEEALAAARHRHPDLVLLDLMLPGIDGLAVCRALKKDPRLAQVPVIMLTAKGEEADVVAGLELGADDYVTKPFSPRVLLARLRAVLRRGSDAAEPTGAGLSVGELFVDTGRHQTLVAGQEVELTATEFRILAFLARRPGWVFTRQQIVDAAQSDDYGGSERFVTERSIDVHMVGLRRKLGHCGSYVQTVRGVGYRLRSGETESVR